jgi:hypothetical protein
MKPVITSIGFTHISITDSYHAAFHCNELTLINKGTVDANISGFFVLAAGQSITYHAWPHERNDTIYDITPAQSGVNGFLIIAVCKNYN